MQQLSCSSLEDLHPRPSSPPLSPDGQIEPSPSDFPTSLQPSPRPFLSEPSQKDSDDDIPEDECKGFNITEESDEKKRERRNIWPQIESIITKIQRLEEELFQERCKNKQLQLQIVEQRKQSIQLQEEIKKHLASLESQQKIIEQSNSTINALRDQLRLKEAVLQERQETLGNMQVAHLQKSMEAQERIKKLMAEQRENNEKMRKANIEVQKEKNVNIELKKEMSQRIEQLQSDKEVYLMDEVEKLKNLLQISKEEREMALGEQIIRLKTKIYQISEQLHKKNIQLAFMERKKQQAVNDSMEKKDQELKMQKMLFKSLQERFGKLQEENKGLKAKNSPRVNRLIDSHPKEEEVTLELSP